MIYREILKKTVSSLERIRARKPTILVVKMVLKSNVFWKKVKKLVKAAGYQWRCDVVIQGLHCGEAVHEELCTGEGAAQVCLQ